MTEQKSRLVIEVDSQKAKSNIDKLDNSLEKVERQRNKASNSLSKIGASGSNLTIANKAMLGLAASA